MDFYCTQLIRWIETDPEMMMLFQIVHSLHIKNGVLAAGVIRNFVWDHLHQYSTRTPLNDVDIVYFEPNQLDETMDIELEKELKVIAPKYQWQVRNQARMHIRNGHVPYKSVENAMRYWPETATAVGMGLKDDGTWHVVAPYGLNDLFNLSLRKSPNCRDPLLFLERINNKKWLKSWPKLKVENEEETSHESSTHQTTR